MRRSVYTPAVNETKFYLIIRVISIPSEAKRAQDEGLELLTVLFTARIIPRVNCESCKKIFDVIDIKPPSL